ncbi:MAG: hypothetical protein Greene101415_1002 [Parcubacteria group bacterium Greene1014_15]|nr:MAG: hypothetical protein Greene101415_1002 [Parcubacteria group bacterium Greene1014_15]
MVTRVSAPAVFVRPVPVKSVKSSVASLIEVLATSAALSTDCEAEMLPVVRCPPAKVVVPVASKS